MQLQNPIVITSRLLAGVRVGDGWISIDYAGQTSDGRQRYRYWIDLPDGSAHTGDDLRSGVGGGSLQAGLESLLSFLGAAAEAWDERPSVRGENADLFPELVTRWAAEHEDEISLLALEVQETADLILE